ncbi:LOG family protein [Fulvivirga lutea]|uniref:Cytokinin riboside 5'-monophosphate phosphoribohydrolase n=1 Tax=Fulvivirga lutea TaxID=2810512 RepID=A0A974WI29_9BACT|nr:TIGR00730 family Rossman fold protein [Fulvivirga lutea]QSE98153.1 TIGR00730 family Rossman fold protein [Fulvivirga lutea]
MKNICVFCGSSFGNSPAYKNSAIELGELLAQKKYRLVYGGGNVGLMGVIADTVIKCGGEVIGVIPEFLQQREVGHTGLTELIVVDSMHQRKMKMAELADAFIAMPGGFGTLEELAEITTWVQLNLMNKPIGVLNVNGYYNHLQEFIGKMNKEKFISVENSNLIQFDNQPKELLAQLESSNGQNNSLLRSKI